MNGFRNILIALDGSEYAEQAVAVGGAIARRSGGALRLVSVEEPLPALVLASGSPGVASEVELEEMRPPHPLPGLDRRGGAAGAGRTG